MSTERANQRDVLDRVREAVKDIESAKTASELRAAYELIPGNKPTLGDQFIKPVTEIRDQLLDQIRPNIQRAEVVFKERMTLLWRRWIPTFTQNCLRLVILFLGYAAIGHHPDSDYTMLESILQWFKKFRKSPEKLSAENVSGSGSGPWVEEDKT